MDPSVKHRSVSGELPYYELSDQEMGLGSSLGNGRAWVNTGTDGRILPMFATDVGQCVAGPMILRYASPTSGNPGEVNPGTGIALSADGPGTFDIHPAYQCHHFRLPGGLSVAETVCLPLGDVGSTEDVCAVYRVVEIVNHSQRRRQVRAFAIAGLSGMRRDLTVAAEYDPDLHGFVATRPKHDNDGFRVLCATTQPVGHTLTADLASLYDPVRLPELTGPDRDQGELLGCLAVDADLAPGQRTRFAFLLAYAPGERDAVTQIAPRLRDFEPVLERSNQWLAHQLGACQVATPDPVINEGAMWARINMLRVLAHYPQGLSFTNEPGVSSNVVTRDVAWFVYGCDHFRPDASRKMLDALVRTQREDGKVPEYYNAITGRTEDYGLNISDPTPLFILAINHHVRSTGDVDYLRQVYDAVTRAADYILCQRDERGLVVCTSRGVKEHGIASWRNVIPNYQISGAVTEINSECAAALRAAGHLARNLGQPDEEADRFTDQARALTEAIQKHLLDPRRQLYLLNIGPDGTRHTDVTADEVFPVLFRVADDATAHQIIRRLTDVDFWTSAGLRTASRLDLRYDPSADVGLVGGVWPGMTWWFAFAAARYNARMMVDALHTSFAHYMRDPRIYNTVPGQFSEWFDGESLINRGMRLSPWEPPRFLWTAVEGVAGLMIAPGSASLNPLRPTGWTWTSLRRVWYHGRQVSFFTVREREQTRTFTTLQMQPDDPGRTELFDEDVSDAVRVGHAEVHALALRNADRVIVALGSARDQVLTTPADLSNLLDPKGSYELRQRSSDQDQWIGPRNGSGMQWRNLAVRLPAQGYHLLELRPTDSPKAKPR